MSDQLRKPLLRGGIVLPRDGRRVAGDRDCSVALPEFGMVVGGDSHSAGASAWLWLPTAGQHPSWKLLAAHRWSDRVQSGEEAVSIAYRLLRHIAEDQGYLLD